MFSVLSLPVPAGKGCVIRRMKNGPLMIPGALKQEEVEFREELNKPIKAG